MKTDIRKYLFAAATLALMLIATGCEKKAGMPGQAEGNAVETSICVNMPDYGTDVKSDAVPGDASYVNRCVMQAFIVNEDGSLSAYGDRQTATVTGGKADFGKTGFVSGYDYKIVFWADYTENGLEDYFYDCSALPEVRLANENDIAFNNDRADGFCGVYEILAEEGIPQSIAQTLKRPFAMLNFFSSDSADDEMLVMSSGAFDIGLPVGLNIVTGENIFSENVIIAEPAAVPTAVSDKGEYLGFCYIFAPAESQYMLPAFDIAFFDSEGNDSYMASPVEANTIGIQANVRTNISGIRLITRI